MDPSTSNAAALAAVPIRPAPIRRDSGNKFTRPGDRERYEYEKAKASTARQRTRGSGTRKRERRFHQLREKYDQVTATNEHYQQDLERANAKMKALQAEMDLLLDAMSIALPSEPVLERFYNEPIYGPPAPSPETPSDFAPPLQYFAPAPAPDAPYANGAYRAQHTSNGHAGSHPRPPSPSPPPRDDR
ncbi:hypothetical protein GLOTRDRAFT_92716 [Gloeophyllum trabeum ATCC 11539]|uniref:BZIP domain-containing protein n=1 Tax=Gloeophyllum trabeum (strain ATCC 11539 / FP-39264 / Madison 617) TaxID=670483 RepID=S7QA04_GLOTA|nr:uncharacterized protein GLOTRDRAFT_92716 [Gloeophyllum trabeum ATCC 11539]EPQ56183.1 hypothetical protein GLOTRDRAFT_92716 [Gloeophyllum trabeum ATCC 11539]